MLHGVAWCCVASCCVVLYVLCYGACSRVVPRRGVVLHLVFVVCSVLRVVFRGLSYVLCVVCCVLRFVCYVLCAVC